MQDHEIQDGDIVESEMDAEASIGDQDLPGDVHASLPHYAEAGPVYFYGGPFSNFVGGPFEITAEQPWSKRPYTAMYDTVEHFFQASKATNLDDHERIRRATGPWQAKKRGRTVQMREDWEQPSVPTEEGDDPVTSFPVKYEVMMVGLRVKFAEEPWRTELLDTGGREIAEDSPTDAVWGIRGEDGQLSGQNLLGQALMQVRAEIRQQS